MREFRKDNKSFDVESRIRIVGPDTSPRQEDAEREMMAASALNILAGVWLIFAPFVLRFSDLGGIAWCTGIIGGIVALIAVIRVLGAHRAVALSWVNATLGAVLIVSPFIFGDEGVAVVVWNSVILGVIVMGLSIWSARATKRMLPH